MTSEAHQEVLLIGNLDFERVMEVERGMGDRRFVFDNARDLSELPINFRACPLPGLKALSLLGEEPRSAAYLTTDCTDFTDSDSANHSRAKTLSSQGPERVTPVGAATSAIEQPGASEVGSLSEWIAMV
jgi:hypothetical protein